MRRAAWIIPVRPKINLGTLRRFHWFLAVRTVDTDINTLVLQYWIICAEICIKYHSERVHRSNLWVKRCVILIWKKVGVQIFEPNIRKLIAVIPLNNNDGRSFTLLDDLANNIWQTTVDELGVIDITLNVNLTVNSFTDSFFVIICIQVH